MSYVQGWHAWFADGSEFSSLTHKPTELPTTGMLVWMLYFRDGTRRILHGNENYFWQDNGSDDGVFGQGDDTETETLTRYPSSHFITGQLVADDLYESTLSAATARKTP